MPKAKTSVVSPQTVDIQTMKSLQASLSTTLNGIDLGPFQEDNQDAFQALTSQIAVSLSPVTMEDNHTHWSIPGVIEVVQDSETFFPQAKLGIYLFLAVQAGEMWEHDQLLDNLGGFRPIHRIYSALDVVRDDPRLRLHNAIVIREG
jgi:hypothetical protein